MILAIDFDRVLHDIDNPIKGRRMGPPLPGAVNSMHHLKDMKHTLIIHTLWAKTVSGTEAVRKWCEYWSMPYDQITAIKPKADVYLDDLAIRFVNWEQAIKAIGRI